MTPRTSTWLRALTAVPLGVTALVFLIITRNAPITLGTVAAIGYAGSLPVNRSDERFARLASFFGGGILFYAVYVGTSLMAYEWLVLGEGPTSLAGIDPSWWYHLFITLGLLVLFWTKRDRIPFLLGGMSAFMLAAPVMIVLEALFGRELWGSEKNIILYTSLGALLLAISQLAARIAPQRYLAALPTVRRFIVASLWLSFLVQLAALPVLTARSAPQPPLGDASGEVGFIGCSNTSQAVVGSRLAGRSPFWAVDERTVRDYDGGAVVDWLADLPAQRRFWRVFDARLADHPQTKAVWWQLCVRHQDPESTASDLLPIIAAVRERLPTAPITVSALPPYVSGSCEITGTAGLAAASRLVDELLATEQVARGPTLAPVEVEELADDGCHLTETGARRQGTELVRFFADILPRGVD